MKYDSYTVLIDLISNSQLNNKQQIKLFNYLTELRDVNMNREKFIDYCLKNYPKAVENYLGGNEKL